MEKSGNNEKGKNCIRLEQSGEQNAPVSKKEEVYGSRF